MKSEVNVEFLNYVRLCRTSHIGTVTFHKLIAQYGSATRAIEVLPTLNSAKKFNVPTRDAIEAELAHIRTGGGAILTLLDPAYPDRLRETELPPPIISVMGDVDLFCRPTVAIVGARNASAAGLKMTEGLARDLGEAGFVVVSGLARGIDGAAHKASLATGTIAVLAGGVDQPYPPQHTGLYREVADRGLVVSERPWGYGATARDFPRRNRIVAALCDGLIVVEAAQRSGSLISARLAGELGREVMAVPGSPLDARSSGTNQLIKDGAILVRDADDILAALEGFSSRQPNLFVRESVAPLEYGVDFQARAQAGSVGETTVAPQDSAIEHLLSVLSIHPMPIHRLADALNVSAAECAGLITELELSGQVKTYAGGGVGLSVD